MPPRKRKSITVDAPDDSVSFSPPSPKNGHNVSHSPDPRRGSVTISATPSVSPCPSLTPLPRESYVRHQVALTSPRHSCGGGSKGDQQGTLFYAPPNYTSFTYLAEGTFGCVCTALRGGVKVAVKKLHCKDNVTSESALRELHNLSFFARAGVPGVCRMLDCWVHQPNRRKNADTYTYLVLEMYEGGSLDQFVPRNRRLTARQWRRVSRRTLQSLAGVHACGGVHRDLKPENLVLSEDLRSVALIDLGSIRCARDSPVCSQRPMTPINQVATEGYRGPECLDDELAYGQPFDVFAAGCALAHVRLHRELFPTQSSLRDFAELGAEGGTAFVREQLKGWARSDVELLEGMLTLDPGKRLTAAEAEACLRASALEGCDDSSSDDGSDDGGEKGENGDDSRGGGGDSDAPVRAAASAAVYEEPVYDFNCLKSIHEALRQAVEVHHRFLAFQRESPTPALPVFVSADDESHAAGLGPLCHVSAAKRRKSMPF